MKEPPFSRLPHPDLEVLEIELETLLQDKRVADDCPFTTQDLEAQIEKLLS